MAEQFKSARLLTEAQVERVFLETPRERAIGWLQTVIWQTAVTARSHIGAERVASILFGIYERIEAGMPEPDFRAIPQRSAPKEATTWREIGARIWARMEPGFTIGFAIGMVFAALLQFWASRI